MVTTVYERENCAADCLLGPFQLIPHSQEEPATKFSDFGNPHIMMKSCFLKKGKLVLVKFPENAKEVELQWLDQSYVDFNVSKKVLYFKVRKCIHSCFSLTKFKISLFFFFSGKNQFQICKGR
jgi:hypothetical protein